MGTIGSVGGYYQLSSLLSSGSGSSTSSSSAASSLEALENALFSSSASGSSSSDPSAYLLDLSPQAQSLLSGSSTSSSSGQSTQFTLTSAQESQIKDILEKYKDAPLTQGTFQEIQNSLQAAGLAPQTLGAEDQVKSFNPTNVLLNALSGNYSSVTDPSSTQSSEQTKESNYMQSIVSLWKSIDTSESSGSGASSASGSTA